MPWPHREEIDFARRLKGLAERHDGVARGALAAMRRGLGKEPGEAGEALRAIFPLLPAGLAMAQEDAYFLIASLAAWHPLHWTPNDGARQPSSLGASFAWLQRDQGGESVERRFAALLNSHPDDLPGNLRNAIGLLKAHDVRVDYARLLRDVQEWDADDRRVQREWARDFWAGRRPEAEDTESEEPATELSAVE